MRLVDPRIAASLTIQRVVHAAGEVSDDGHEYTQA